MSAVTVKAESSRDKRYFISRVILVLIFMISVPVALQLMSIDAFPTYKVFIAAVISITLALIATPAWIEFLQLRGIGQQIRHDGPQEHLVKSGTPTMGGLLILATMIFSYMIMVEPWENPGEHILGIVAVVVTVACGAIGFFDDFSKIRKTRSLGLKARSKIAAQLVIAVGISWVVVQYLGADATKITAPLIQGQIDLGYFYFVLIFLIVVGTTNAVNLTDGLDGLAAGTVTVVLLSYGAIAFRQGNLDLALFCTAVAGACIGFLWYNAYPANIFMGDTGSLALGGAVAIMAILTKTELLLLLIGGIFVIEALSVIIQVGSYRLFGKRPLKMAPIHHHFELLGWSETTIMVRFWIITGVLSGLGFSLFFISTLVD